MCSTRASSRDCCMQSRVTRYGSGTAPVGAERDRLMLALFAFAGLRRSELLGLDWADVDLERRLLRVRKAKGGRQRVVPLHPALEPLVTDYLRIRAGDGEPALFVGMHGRRLSTTIMVQTFLRYARAAGVTERKRVTPHTLRHVFASELLQAGAQPAQELLGHKHLDSTQRYTRVNAHELRGGQATAVPDDAEGRVRLSTTRTVDGHHRRPSCPVGIPSRLRPLAIAPSVAPA